MQQIFTPELLVKHLYNETTTKEAEIINEAIAKNATLKQEFNRLQTAKNALNEDDGELPKASTIENILSYSKQQHVSEVE
ncbi:MAG: hypothetical protein R2739_02955 [Chitinophagales bacterium]